MDFRVGGKRYRRRLPIKDIKMQALATRLAEGIYRDAWAEELAPSASTKKVTFAEAADLYVQAGGEERFLPKLVHHFGKTRLANEIDEIEIAKAAKSIYPNARPDTLRRQVRVPVRAVQNFAQGKRRQKSFDVRRTRWLSPEEAERLLVAAANPEDAGLRDRQKQTLRKIAFMLGTGAGPGETMSLTASGWDPETREWWLPGTKTVYRARYVTLPERVVQLIGEIPGSGPAFPAPNGEAYILRDNRGGQMAVAFSKIRKAAGLGQDVVPYTLRHTWATWFYAQTRDWAALLDQGGWSRSDTANRYRKLAPKNLGNKLFAHGWDFRADPGKPVKFGELISVSPSFRNTKKSPRDRSEK